MCTVLTALQMKFLCEMQVWCERHETRLQFMFCVKVIKFYNTCSADQTEIGPDFINLELANVVRKLGQDFKDRGWKVKDAQEKCRRQHLAERRMFLKHNGSPTRVAYCILVKSRDRKKDWNPWKRERMSIILRRQCWSEVGLCTFQTTGETGSLAPGSWTSGEITLVYWELP